jgi:hypothetical protein
VLLNYYQVKMQEYKTIIGFITIIIALVSYSFYFKNVIFGNTKPQPFSWFVWSVLSAIAFSAQISKDAGPGAWVTGFTAIVCLIISVLASFKMDWRFKVLDWFCLFAALLALIVWHYASSPNLAVVLVAVAYCLGFVPTFFKGFYKPAEETALTFGLNSIKFGLSIFALNTFSPATWLYPITLFVINGLFAIMLLARRKN